MKTKLITFLIIFISLGEFLLAQENQPFIRITTSSSNPIEMKIAATSNNQEIIITRGDEIKKIILGVKEEKINITGEDSLVILEGNISSISCIGAEINTIQNSISHPLTKLVLNKNNIRSINIDNLPFLQSLGLSDCHLTYIDLSKGTNLNNINLNNNQISSLDLSSCKKLIRLQIAGNKLDACTLNAIYKTLPKLPTSSKTANLINGKLGDNNEASKSKTSIAEELNWKVQIPGDGSGCDKDNIEPQISFITSKREAQIFYFRMEQSGNVEFSVDWGNGIKKSYNLIQEDNGKVLSLEGIPLADNVIFYGVFTRFEANNAEITSINLSKAPALTYLGLRHNHLSSIDLSSNSLLKNLYLRDNQILELNLNSCPLLETLYIRDNLIKELNLSPTPYLKELAVSRNPLKLLDLSKTPLLNKLYAAGLQLKTIDLSLLPLLYQIEINNNELSKLDISKCPEIGFIDIENNNFSTCALNDLYYQLPKPKRKIEWINLKLGGKKNEVNTSFTDIALAKGWKPNILGNGSECPIIKPAILLESSKGYAESIEIKYKSIDSCKIYGADMIENNKYQLYSKKVFIDGDITDITLCKNNLTDIKLLNQKHLLSLNVSNNNLRKIDLSSASQVKYISIHSNQFGENVLIELIQSLPRREKSDNAIIIAIDTKNPAEKNKITEPIILLSKEKNWNIYDYKGGINNGNGEIYQDSKMDVQLKNNKSPILYYSSSFHKINIKYLPHKKVLIYSNTGELLFKAYCNNEGDATLDLSLLPKGKYILRIDKITKKFNLNSL